MSVQIHPTLLDATCYWCWLLFDDVGSIEFKRLGPFNVAKYHLGKVKLERVGQQSSPTSVCDLRGGLRGIAGLLVCPFASVALHCSFACCS